MYLTKCDIEMLQRIARNNPGDGSRVVHHFMQLVVDLGDWAERMAGVPIGEILRPTMPSVDPDHPHFRAREGNAVNQMELEPLDSQENNLLSAIIDFRNAKLAEG